MRFCEIEDSRGYTFTAREKKKKVAVGEHSSCGCGWVRGSDLPGSPFVEYPNVRRGVVSFKAGRLLIYQHDY